MLSNSRSITASSRFHLSGSLQTDSITVQFMLACREFSLEWKLWHRWWDQAPTNRWKGIRNVPARPPDPNLKPAESLQQLTFALFQRWVNCWCPPASSSVSGLRLLESINRRLSSWTRKSLHAHYLPSLSQRLRNPQDWKEMTNQYVGGCIYSFCICFGTKSCSRSSIN